MTKKRTRSLSPSNLAAGQCLLLFLYLSTAPLSGAWIHFPATTRTIAGWYPKYAGRSRRNTSKSLGAGEGVMDFVNGLDAALGNPTAYSAASQASAATAPAVSSSITALEATGGAVNMNIPNSVVLAGGGVAVLAFLGLAFFFMTQQGGGDSKSQDPNGVNMRSFGIEEVAPLPKVNIDENVLSRQLEAREQLEKTTLAPAATEDEFAADFGGDRSGNLPDQNHEILKAKDDLREEIEMEVQSITKELTENRKLLASEIDLRKVAELKLDEATAANEGVKEKLANQVQALAEMTEKWSFTKTKLQEEIKLKETLKSELKLAAESNRLLEDKYELEQNTLQKTKKELDLSQATLGKTQDRLERTQSQLTRVHGELQITQQILTETSEDLAKLEEENRSIRMLGKSIWRLSKSRVRNRIQSIGDRFRGRIPKKNKKLKKN